MQIISVFLRKLNNLVEKNDDKITTITVFGPTELSEQFKREYSGHKIYSWGTYRRKLFVGFILIEFVIQRYYIPTLHKTVSLLPHFITPYERYPNKLIDKVLLLYAAKMSQEGIVEMLSHTHSISSNTIKRWLSKFKDRVNRLEELLEKRLIETVPSYPPDKRPSTDFGDAVKKVFQKAAEIVTDKLKLAEYGTMSWLNLNTGTWYTRKKHTVFVTLFCTP